MPNLLMRLTQSSVTGLWGYCPDNCPLCKGMAYDEDTGYPTAAAAEEAARADPNTRRYVLSFKTVPQSNPLGTEANPTPYAQAVAYADPSAEEDNGEPDMRGSFRPDFVNHRGE